MCAWSISKVQGLVKRLRFIQTFKWFIYLRLDDLPLGARGPFRVDSYVQSSFKRLRFIQTLRFIQSVTVYSDA